MTYSLIYASFTMNFTPFPAGDESAVRNGLSAAGVDFAPSRM